MPLTVNVGVSKKIGQPDFGSLGASCQIAIELDPSLHDSDLEAFHGRIKKVFLACRQAVDEELASRIAVESNPSAGTENKAVNGHADAANGPKASVQTRNGHAGNGHAGQRRGDNGQQRSNARSATESQVRAIRAIAGRQRIDLAGLLQERFCVARPEELGLPDASALIDELKSSAHSRGDRR